VSRAASYSAIHELQELVGVREVLRDESGNVARSIDAFDPDGGWAICRDIGSGPPTVEAVLRGERDGVEIEAAS